MNGLWVIAVIGCALLLLGFIFLLLAGGASALKNPALRRAKPTIKVPVEPDPAPPRILTISTSDNPTTGGPNCQCQYCREVRRIRESKRKQ